MKVLRTLFICLLIAGCGNSNSPKGQAGSDDFGAFQSSPPSQVPNLISAYGIQSTDGTYNVGGFVAFYSGNKYFAGVVNQLSSQHYQIQGAVGYYQQGGGQVQVTPKKHTCPTASANGTTITGSDSASSLTVTNGSTTVVLPQITVPVGGSTQGILVDWGCFNSDGSFSKYSWSNY